MRLLPVLFTSLTLVATGALCSAAESASIAPVEFVQEVVQVKYARAADTAAIFNHLGTNPPSLTSYNGAFAGIISNAWTRLSDRFKETNTARDSSLRQTIVSGQDRVIADERTNELLLSGTVADVKVLKEAVSALDVIAPQVLVEGVVLKVTLPDAPGASGPNWLHDWLQARKGFSADPTGLVSGAARRLVSFTALNTTNGSMVCSKCFSQVADLSDDLDAVLRDLAEQDGASILMRPRIQTSLGEPAIFFVGKTHPYPAGTMASYTCASSLQQLQIGATIEVTITLDHDTSLQFQIHQVSEETNGAVQIANVGSVPITRRHESQAELSVQNGKTIVIGGSSEPGSRGQRQHVLFILRPTLLPAPGSVAAGRREP